MIKASSLKIWLTTTGVCGVLALAAAPAAAQEAAPEKPGGTTPSQSSDQATQVDDVIVTGTAVSHLADRSRTGTRMDTDPLDLPLSVSTVSEELIQRQQAITLADAASNVVGVSSGNEGSFSMRGFSANIMRNGNLGADGRSNNLPIVAVSRLEVVKGPEAIIAGMAAGYGGVVNVITKTPPNALTAEVTSTVGSHGYYDAGFDVGGPLNREKTFLARLVASTQDQDENVAGYDGSSMDYVAPSATFRIPKWGTEFTAQYEYQDIRNAPPLSVVSYGDRLTSDLPLIRYGSADEGQSIKSRTTTLSLEQRINEDWSLAVRYYDDSQDRTSNTPSAFPFPDFVPYPDVLVLGFVGGTTADVRSTKVELRGNFNTGPIEHKLLAAFDTSDTEVSVGNALTTIRTTNLETGVTTDRTADLGPLFGAPGPVLGGGTQSKETGLLLLDQMAWKNWVVLAGVRRIRYEENALNAPGAEALEKTLPSLGIVYKVTPDVSLYGNASKGFKSNQGLYAVGGSTVEPEDAQQYELGVKALLMHQRIAASLSTYIIEQENVAVPDPVNLYPLVQCLGSSMVCHISVPGVTSRGFEVELSGEILPRLDVRANYSYTDKEADVPAQTGIFYAPHQASLWATYSFQNNRMGWWVGGGLQARSARNNEGFPNELQNPGQTRIDLSTGYEANSWSAVFGVKNVADERLYDVASGLSGMGTVVQPREWFATLRYRFR
ncbi:Ferric-pseudobactin receptor precursor [compost metagenome]